MEILQKGHFRQKCKARYLSDIKRSHSTQDCTKTVQIQPREKLKMKATSTLSTAEGLNYRHTINSKALQQDVG